MSHTINHVVGDMGELQELSWAAGYWEADGHCSWSIEPGKTYRDIGVTSTDRDVLEQLQAIFCCGVIRDETPRGYGNKPYYRWRLWRKADAMLFVESILPFVKGLRRQDQLQQFLIDQTSIPSGWHSHKDNR